MVKININCSSESLHISHKIKKKKNYYWNRSILISLFNLNFIRLTGAVIDGFDLTFNKSRLFVTTRVVNKGVISE